MALNGVGRRFATPRRRLIAAYLRVLGNPRSTRSGLRSLRDQIEPRLQALVADALGVEPVDLARDTSLIGDLAADSLDVLDVVTRVEALYDVVFPEREITAIVTYGDLAALTTALVACRMRAQEQTLPAAPIEVRIGEGAVPRFVRVMDSGGYDREILRDDLRSARIDDPVTVTRAGRSLSAPVERALLRARLAGADVRMDDDADAPFASPADREEARGWSARRLVETSLAVVGELGAERDASLATLGAPSRLLAKMLAGTRAATVERIAAFRAVAETYLDVLDDSRTILHVAAHELGRLDAVRRAVDEHAMDVKETCDAYDSIADALLSYVHALQSLAGAPPTRLPARRMAAGQETSASDRTMLRA